MGRISKFGTINFLNEASLHASLIASLWYLPIFYASFAGGGGAYPFCLV